MLTEKQIDEAIPEIKSLSLKQKEAAICFCGHKLVDHNFETDTYGAWLADCTHLEECGCVQFMSKENLLDKVKKMRSLKVVH